ncbi:hypothetical protein DVH24_021807 [Malus domestica]|uniref:Sm domain-containing protein n=1 Tax=Malus domestica TaxID=3750 RepID=A0A498IWP7_MALDO|nr:hypothetical protein DVH24_021807 [Malus domestica]
MLIYTNFFNFFLLIFPSTLNLNWLFFSYFKELVGREVTVELKNDLAIRGTLHSVDQYLNIKLENTRVVDQDKYPHMGSNFLFGAVGKIFQSIGHWSLDSDSDLLGFVGPFGSSRTLLLSIFYADFVFCPMLKEHMSVRNCFIRGSVVRYVQLPPEGVDVELLHDATRREARTRGIAETRRELSVGELGRVERLELPPTPLQFLRDYVNQNKPCIISNATSTGRPSHSWTDDSYLAGALSSIDISLHLTPRGQADALVPLDGSLCFASAHVERVSFPVALSLVANDESPSKLVAYAQQQNNCFPSEYSALAGDCDPQIP